MTKPSLFVGVLFCFVTFCSPTVAEDETLRIFTLSNADSGEMAELLHTLSDGSLTVAEDRRTNSIVVKGTEQAMVVIEAVLLKLDKAKSHKQSRHAEPTAQESAERRGDEERIHALERAEQEKLHHRRMLDFELKRDSVQHQVEFLKRKMEMVAAEAKLEQAIMEAEIKATSQKLEALNVQLELATARFATQGGEQEGLVMREAERVDVLHAVEILKMKLDFHMKHIAPMRQMEVEMKLQEKHREVESLHNRND